MPSSRNGSRTGSRVRVQTVDPDSSAGTDSEDDFNPNRSRYAKIEAQNSLILHNGNVLAMSTPRKHRRQTLVPDLGQLPEKAAVPRTVRRLPGGITRGETVPPDLGQLREKAAVPKNVRRLSGGITRGDTVPPDLGQLPEKAAVPRIVRRLPGGITRGEIVSPLVHSARSTAQVNKRNAWVDDLQTPRASRPTTAISRCSQDSVSFDAQDTSSSSQRSLALRATSQDLASSQGSATQESTADHEHVFPTLATRCVDCGVNFDELAHGRYCLACGGLRVYSNLFDDLFRMLASSRATVRRADLSKFHMKIQESMQKMMNRSKKSSMKQMMDITCAFDGALKLQTDSGCRYTQGITKKFLFDFLWLAAENLGLTCRTLINGMLGDGEPDSQDAQESMAQGLPELRLLHNTTENACPFCGSKVITDSNYCYCCGRKQPPRETRSLEDFHIFEGTRASLLGRAQETIRDGDFAELVRLAQCHHIPLGDVRRFWKEFQEYDVNKDKRLQREEFTDAIRTRCNIPRDDEVPRELIRDQWFKQTAEDGEFVDFEAFLLWSFGTEYVEELIVPDPSERHLRQLASKHSMQPNDVERIKRVFDQYDVAQKGFLEEREFMQTVLHLVRAQRGVSVNHATLERFWQESKNRFEKSISFDAFLGWFLKACLREGW